MSDPNLQVRASRPGAADVLVVPASHLAQIRALGWTIREREPGDPIVAYPMTLTEALALHSAPPASPAPEPATPRGPPAPVSPPASEPSPETIARMEALRGTDGDTARGRLECYTDPELRRVAVEYHVDGAGLDRSALVNAILRAAGYSELAPATRPAKRGRKA